ncbi:hypothetical protein Poli38472_006401 [Pythium oligandrum]|uniref:mRNA capping enzyme adenylation domain-containing protein n=1 Tax=Pythium oligandrum TaxID=41045 RepID=A0A8K1C4I9_PYTOL|nr:hypothetical protein Poli38472_006401 [Pythium oligandrum]|eukprot:TMW56391.1 hypothetical protein Poli38472_006401 [Pythium oligandrum]
MASTPSHAEVAAKLRRASSNGTNGDVDKTPPTRVAKTERKLLHWTPDEWKAFEATPLYTKLVSSARILPIRAPLSSIYEIHFADERANYTPSALMEKLLAQTKAGPMMDVGVVIDATGSDNYLFDPKEWYDWDVKYVKLRTVIPEEADEKTRAEAEEAMTKEFLDELEKHKTSDIKDRDVAVFGATGYNFVGYLIASFLVEACDLSLANALQEFAASTPPGIYSRHYLERLYRKFFSTLPSSASTVKCPAPPKWDASAPSDDAGSKIGNDILTDEDRQNKFVRKDKPRVTVSSQSTGPVTSAASATPTGRSGGLPAGPTYKPPMYIPPDREDINTRPTKRRKIRSWVDDVQPLEYGEALDTASEEHERLSKALEKLTGHEGFPGCEAIPLTATHVASEAFKKRGCLTPSYLVTWRARGRRCMLFIAEGGVYVVSRDMTFTKVNMKFPRRRAPAESQVNTLIDGIIVEDEDHDHKVARYLTFDIVFLEGTPIWQKKLEKRLQCLQNEIILPRKNDQTFDYAKEPFRVRMKDHFRLAKTEFLLSKFVKDVTHEVEGVLFTPTEAPYNLGGFETEDPVFKFVASDGSGIPGLDGSIPQRRLLEYIQTIPSK